MSLHFWLNCIFVLSRKNMFVLCFRNFWWRWVIIQLKEKSVAHNEKKWQDSLLAQCTYFKLLRVRKKRPPVPRVKFNEILLQYFDTLLLASLLFFNKTLNAVYWSKLAANFLRLLAACFPDGLDKTIRYYIKNPIPQVSARRIFQVMTLSCLPGQV